MDGVCIGLTSSSCVTFAEKSTGLGRALSMVMRCSRDRSSRLGVLSLAETPTVGYLPQWCAVNRVACSDRRTMHDG